MGIFKEKVSFDEFTILIYRLGYHWTNSTKEFLLKNNIIFNDTVLFVLMETIMSTLASKYIESSNIIESVNKNVYESFGNEDKDNILYYFVSIKNDVYNLIFNSIYIKDLVNYFFNEITDSEKHDIDINIVAQFCDIFGEINNAVRYLISNLKIIY